MVRELGDRAAFAIGAVCLAIGALAGMTLGPSAQEAAEPMRAYQRERCFEDETLLWVGDDLACVPTDSLPPR